MNAKWIAPFLAVLAACGPPPSAYVYAEEPDPRKAEYVLGPADVISIGVWGMDDLSDNAQIRPDGTLTLPLIGDVRAAGRTPSELKAELQQRVKTYVRDESAVVSVAVAEVHSYQVVVTGRVGSPGVVESDHFMTVSEAMARAGDPTPFGRPRRLVLVRQRPDGSVVRIPIRYDLLRVGAVPEQDLVLLPGDRLYLP